MKFCRTEGGRFSYRKTDLYAMGRKKRTKNLDVGLTAGPAAIGGAGQEKG